MNDDTPTLPASTGAVDWASKTHVAAVVDPEGILTESREFEHNAIGLKKMVAWFRHHHVDRVAIERGDGPMVDALLDAGLIVFVIHPRQMKNMRGRYGNAGNKDDRLDAYVLADVLRTDHRRLRPLERDTDPTISLRSLVRARKDLVEARVALTNQLLANLNMVLPATVGLFSRLDSKISLAFLHRYRTQQDLDWLSPTRIDAWLKSRSYPGRTTGQQFHDRIVAAADGPSGVVADTLAMVTDALVEAIAALNGQIDRLRKQIQGALDEHPDADIFTSFPKAGMVRAATMLAEIGDARGRFPTDDSLAALAGCCPSTRSSGKMHAVTFRYACDKKLRNAITDFADDSRQASPWAADIYARARARGKSHPHAVRILARAWIRVIWRCWQDGVAYNPKLHGGNQKLAIPVAA